jgi:UPF0271 protein
MAEVATIELNADFGEGFSVYPMPAQVWRAEFDNGGALVPSRDTPALPMEEYLGYLSSVNLSCGFHAGDPLLIKRYVAIALEAGCSIGAHVSFPDLAGFGNRYMKMAPDDLKAVLQYQLGALGGLVAMHDRRLSHVKAHGALYNYSMVEAPLAAAVAEAVAEFDDELFVYGLTGSEMETAAERKGVPFLREGFSDRAYHSTGLLVDRAQDRAMVLDADAVAERVLLMARKGVVRSIEGDEVVIRPQTISFHSDTPNAWQMLTASVSALVEAGISIPGSRASGEARRRAS